MGPARLIILRHAEKTADKQDRNLSPAGRERAAQLVRYIPEIKSKFDDDEFDALIVALGEKGAYRGKFGVISWRHSNMLRLVAGLGSPINTLPVEWDDADYTTLIDISYGTDGKVTAKRLTMTF
jgi:hypothetical protein